MRKYLVVVFILMASLSLFAASCPDVGDLEIFPKDNFWNWDMTEFEKHPDSGSIILAINTTSRSGYTKLHPDYGPEYGIPYSFVGKENVKINLKQREETDFGPMPIPLNAPVEGIFSAKSISKYPDPHKYQDPSNTGGGDKHVLVLDKEGKKLYELFDALPQPYGSKADHWTAQNACIWDLAKNEMRAKGETSCDAAGLAIFPGLVRYEEVAKGEIKHAIRCTFEKTRNTYIFPASHKASKLTDPYLPQMGMRLRLTKYFDVTGFSTVNQVILKALKKYGMIVADNGGSWFITGAPDDRWKDVDLQEIKKVLAMDFEVVKTVDSNNLTIYPKGIRPKIEYVTGKRGKK